MIRRKEERERRGRNKKEEVGREIEAGLMLSIITQSLRDFYAADATILELKLT